MARVNLSVLMMKLTCDTNPAHRNRIVRDHMRLQGSEDVDHCFWDLVAACPDQIDVFQSFSGSPTPSLPRIKKLMMHYYKYFKSSAHYDKKFLDYNCVGECDPLGKVAEFCQSPTKKARASMTELYKFIDARVERVLRRCLPEGYFNGCFDGPGAFPAYRDYDNVMVEIAPNVFAERLTRWQGKVLLQISMGKTRALAWEGYDRRAKTFHKTTNADVNGVLDRITSFISPVRPRRPEGWFSFSLPISFCKENYARIVKEEEDLKEHKRSRKAVRRIQCEDDVLRCAEEIKRRRGMAE